MIVEKVDLVADRAKCINEYSHVFKVAPKEIEDQIKKVLDELDIGIRSGLSYSGATSIPEFQAKARFIRQTSAGAIESSTHIKTR